MTFLVVVLGVIGAAAPASFGTFNKAGGGRATLGCMCVRGREGQGSSSHCKLCLKGQNGATPQHRGMEPVQGRGQGGGCKGRAMCALVAGTLITHMHSSSSPSTMSVPTSHPPHHHPTPILGFCQAPAP